MAWIYLICAGLMEIGWPLGLKLAQKDGWAWQGFSIAIIFMAISGFLLFLAQKLFRWELLMLFGQGSEQ